MATQEHTPSPNQGIRNAHLPSRGGLIDFTELRRQVSITQVLELIGWSPVKQRGAQLRGSCPLHVSSRETSVLFAVNVERNTWFCHSLKCKKGGNQLDLYVQATGLPIYEAAKDLCERLGVEVPRLRL